MLKLLDLIAASCIIAQFWSIENWMIARRSRIITVVTAFQLTSNEIVNWEVIMEEKRANLQIIETVFHCMIKRSQN